MSDEQTTRLAAIRERLEAATPGPWHVNNDDGYWYIYGPDNFQIHDQFNTSGNAEGRAMAVANAALIANAPSDLAYLLDALAAAQAALNTLIVAADGGGWHLSGDCEAEGRADCELCAALRVAMAARASTARVPDRAAALRAAIAAAGAALVAGDQPAALSALLRAAVADDEPRAA